MGRYKNKINDMRWVEYFRKLAHTVKLKSKDENTQIGAIIVGRWDIFTNRIGSLNYLRS